MTQDRKTADAFVVNTGPDLLGLIACDQQLIGRNGWLLTRTVSGTSNEGARYFPAFDLERFDQLKADFSRNVIGLAKRRLELYRDLERTGFMSVIDRLQKHCLISHRQARVWQDSEKLVDLYFKGIRAKHQPPYRD